MSISCTITPSRPVIVKIEQARSIQITLQNGGPLIVTLIPEIGISRSISYAKKSVDVLTLEGIKGVHFSSSTRSRISYTLQL